MEVPLLEESSSVGSSNQGGHKMEKKKNDRSEEKVIRKEEINPGIPRGDHEDFQLDFARCPKHGISYPKGESCPQC